MPSPPHELRKDHTPARLKCFGLVEELEERREVKAASNRPQPWIARKIAISFVIGLIGYTVYVYIVRFCVPMIKRENRRFGGRATGVTLLAVFSVLFLMFCWTYVKIVFTPPGYARDYVPNTPAPAPHIQSPYHPTHLHTRSQDAVAGTPYDRTTSVSRGRSRQGVDHGAATHATTQPTPLSRSPDNSNSRRSGITQHSTNTITNNTTRVSRSAQAVPDTQLPSRTVSNSKAVTGTLPRRPPAAHISGGSASGLPPLLYSRRPPTHPALLPEYRYCSRDGLVKPMRAHHCRTCGTCVLRYDHHCPWIGQCVGAFNHKFFVNFLQWSTVFVIFVFASLTVFNARAPSMDPRLSPDPQQIVVIALSGVFTLFTTLMLFSHVRLVLLNTSTVEHLGQERMRERESSVLSQMTRPPCFSDARPEAYSVPDSRGCHAFRPVILRRKIKRQWDLEWGKISTEGNLWWLGSKQANWEATMGKAKLGWILPIGGSVGDGLVYPTNPRFDHDGRWRRRTEWPESLQ